MEMKKLLALALAMMMVLGCGLAAADTFIHGIDPEYNPFSYLGEDGQYTGFDVEVAQAVCALLELEYDVFPVNWDTKEMQLDARECDVIWSGMTIMPEMLEKYVVSRPYYESTQVMLVKEDSGIATSADLAGKIVAVELGTSGEALLNNELADLAATFQEVTTTDTFLIAFTELEGGAVDAVFVDYPVAFNYMQDHDGLKMIDEGYGAEEYGLLFRAGEEELCAKIEGAIDQLVENGTYAEIAAKYPVIVDHLLFLKAE